MFVRELLIGLYGKLMMSLLSWVDLEDGWTSGWETFWFLHINTRD